MKIVGIDPGLQVTGYGVIEVSKDARLIEAGVIRTKADDGIAERLRKVYQSLCSLLEETKPDVLAIERLYAHYKHPATAILMGHVRGVVCLASGVYRIPLVSVAATHVKKSVTGRGHAGKGQIQRMVQHTLGLKQMPSPPDVADALAVALTCAAQLKGKTR